MGIVLIETLWNVKAAEPVLKSSLSSINRNIVECKVTRKLLFFNNQIRINRNIVECKVIKEWILSQMSSCINRNIVECKEGSCGDSVRNGNCINRNIVECKDISDEEILLLASKY